MVEMVATVLFNYGVKNPHWIEGPNGMCACGRNGKVCGELMVEDVAQLLSEQVAKARAEGREAMRQEAVEAIPSVKFLKKHGAYQYDPNGQLAFGELVGQGTCREYVLDALKSLK